MSQSIPSRLHGSRFSILFGACLCLLFLGFSYGESVLGLLYLYPISVSAAALLNLIGIPTSLSTDSLAEGFCALAMKGVVFQVKHECTGLFALFTYLAAVCAYPSRMVHKVWGVLCGVPLFFVYAACRLTLLGLIAQAMPAWLQYFHVYFLVILTLGFTMFLWATWVRRGPLVGRDGHR